MAQFSSDSWMSLTFVPLGPTYCLMSPALGTLFYVDNNITETGSLVVTELDSNNDYGVASPSVGEAHVLSLSFTELRLDGHVFAKNANGLWSDNTIDSTIWRDISFVNHEGTSSWIFLSAMVSGREESPPF